MMVRASSRRAAAAVGAHGMHRHERAAIIAALPGAVDDDELGGFAIVGDGPRLPAGAATGEVGNGQEAGRHRREIYAARP